MKLSKGIVWSEIVDSSDDELDDLRRVLTFESDDHNIKSLFDETEQRFYTGLIPFLEGTGFVFEYTTSSEVSTTVSAMESLIDEDALAGVKLRDYQIRATRKALHYGRGVLQVCTGGGKTAMAASIIHHFRTYGIVTSVVAITPSVFLMQQMADNFERYGLGNVIRVGGNFKFPKRYNGDEIAVFVVDSAHNAISDPKYNNAGEFIRVAGMLLLEEAHHARSTTWTAVAEECQAPVRLALTATAYESPGRWSHSDLALLGLTGSIIFELRSKELRRRGYLADPVVTMIRTKSGHIPAWSWHNVYNKGIVANKVRNSIIKSLAVSLYEGINKIMIFVGHKKHGHTLARDLALLNCNCIFIHGGSAIHKYNVRGEHDITRWSVSQIAEFVNDNDNCIIVNTSTLDEGIDIPSVNVLIMAAGTKKYRRIIQRCGRGMRPKHPQNKVFIFDFYDDNHVFLSKHSEYRLWTYNEEEFEISSSIEQTSEMIGCPLVLIRDYMR